MDLFNGFTSLITVLFCVPVAVSCTFICCSLTSICFLIRSIWLFRSSNCFVVAASAFTSFSVFVFHILHFLTELSGLRSDLVIILFVVLHPLFSGGAPR